MITSISGFSWRPDMDTGLKASEFNPIEIDRSTWVANQVDAPKTEEGRLMPFDFAGDVGADNSVGKIWGNIEINGKVVAQIYQSGLIAQDSKYALPASALATDSPAERAQAMIKAYGGSLIRRADMANPTLWLG